MPFSDSETYRPFKYPWAVEAEKKQRIDMTWNESQIDLNDDMMQYNSVDGLKTKNFSHAENKRIIDTALLIFTEMDKAVASGYVELLPYTKNNEIKSLFIQQAAKEVVHQRGYALLAETIGFSDADWIAYKQYKEMVSKLEIMSSTQLPVDTPYGYAAKLTQILLGEGIGLFAAFTSLLNFKRFGLIMGFNDVNSWSLADETAHVENNINVLQEVKKHLSHTQLNNLELFTRSCVAVFVEVEESFIDLIGDCQDLDKETFKTYISYLGDLRLKQLGYAPLTNITKNPLPWMDWMLSGTKHDNFFEKRVTDYTHAKLAGSVDYSKYKNLTKKVY